MKNLIKNLIITAIDCLQQQAQLPEGLSFQVQIERTRDATHGDFATNIAMVLAKLTKQNPRQLAEKIVMCLPAQDCIAKVVIADPGFINFHLTQNGFQSVIVDILSNGKDYGRSLLGQNNRVHMEMISSNPTGPLHVGHGRYAAYCGSLANILEASGFHVHREYYVNDAGRQMRILAVSIWMRYLSLFGEIIIFPRNGYQGNYVTDIARKLKIEYLDLFYYNAATVLENLPVDDEEHKEQYIDALIERAQAILGDDHFHKIYAKGLNIIIEEIKSDLSEFGVNCQEWFYESTLIKNGEVARGIAKLREGDYLYERNGALWFRSTDFNDEKDRVVVRENGQLTYFASDIAYHLHKYERGFDQMLDIYGADHHGYIPRINAFLQALGQDVSKLKVLLLQFVSLYRGKVKVSMSTRGGEFVTLRELRQEVGNDAAHFFYIMRKREQHLDFDLELAKSQSSDNPVYYIQYAHARICSVLHQLQLRNWQWQSGEGLTNLHLLNTEHEKELIRSLSRYPEVVEFAATTFEPCGVAHYLQELANHFHAYYNAYQFLVEEVNLRNARLCLIMATRQVLVNGLLLLGLSAPEEMYAISPK